MYKNIKLVALDLDGTSLRSDKSISPRLVKAIADLKQFGVVTVICTGRPPEGILGFAKEFGIYDEKGYAVCFNGASFVSLLNPKEDLIKHTVSAMDMKTCANLALACNCHIHCYGANRELLVHSHNYYTEKEIINCKQPYREVNFDNLEETGEAYKILAVGEEHDLDKLRASLPCEVLSRFSIARTDPHYLEFMPLNKTKGTSLEELCQKLNIDIKDAIAFGDAENDLDMISKVGVGVAMGNAQDLLKQRAKLITKSNDEDGVAIVLEEIIKEKQAAQ